MLVYDILIIEDEKSAANLYKTYLNEPRFDVHICKNGKQALSYLDTMTPDIVLIDINLPDIKGTEILKTIKENHMPSTVIMMTGCGSINTAVDTIRGGAFDFLVKPFNRERLIQTIDQVIEKTNIKQKIELNESKSHKGFNNFIGDSPSMQVVYHMIESAAKSKASVFITGESGTGKEICAETTHALSNRAKKPFVVLNCAAIPKDLMESEIFGHVKGAFTGAISNHDGAASQANGGTLFLDEVCEMDLFLQSKLLRFIQSGTFHKVGSTKMEKVDIRFVCATNRDPLVEIGAGRFREDLFYRLHVLPIHMPPLRDRGQDVITLARNILTKYVKEENKEFTGFSENAEQRIADYHWPGNIRQLQNVLRHAIVLNEGTEITLDMLPPPLDQEPIQQNIIEMEPQIKPLPVPNGTARTQEFYHDHAPNFVSGISSDNICPLWQIEKSAIESAIDHCEGNIPKAAALLEISASTIYRKKQFWDSMVAGA